MFLTIHKEYSLWWRQTLHHSRLLQICLLVAFWYAGQVMSGVSGVPIPGGVLGLFIVLVLFHIGWMRVESLVLGAEWFLAEMLLFFIPVVPAVLNHPEFMGWTGIKIMAIILLGTVVVMVSTAYIVDLCFYHLEKKPGSEQS